VSAQPVWRASRVPFADVARLQEELGVPEPLAWVLVRRGLADPREARAFLDASGPLAPPEAIAGMQEAADRIAQAVRRHERIVVHGDYDCDGVTSTALLLSALRGRGAQAEHFLPSRFAEGYGVAVSTVERLADAGCGCWSASNAAPRRSTRCGAPSIWAWTWSCSITTWPAGCARPASSPTRPWGRPAPDLAGRPPAWCTRWYARSPTGCSPVC